MKATDIYIIYTVKDREIAYNISQTLNSHGISSFIEFTDLTVSDNFQSSIINIIDLSKVVIFLLSENSIKSKYVLKELNFAYAANKPILPILLGKWKKSYDILLEEAGLNLLNFYNMLSYTSDYFEILRDRIIKIIDDVERIQSQNDDIWVFLSHSNEDFSEVRKLRNIMEEHGLRPLMFFLKCLDSDPEIFDLIKREIDVRPRFFLCSSKNAALSKWVQRGLSILSLRKDNILLST